MMKPMLAFASVALALSPAPALADNGQVFDAAAQAHAYPSGGPSRQCFNGRQIAGLNRAGETTVYVQPKAGGIYRLDLTEGCPALDDARKLTIRAGGSDAICAGGGAEMVALTPAGRQSCRVGEVRRLTPKESQALAESAAR